MTDKQDLIREIHEYVTTHGGENTATHLLVQAASAIQTQAAELEAVGAGGVSGPLMGRASLAASAGSEPVAPYSIDADTLGIRYALELGLLWVDGDGRDKVREALDALDILEAELEAIGAGGVSGPLMGRASLSANAGEPRKVFLVATGEEHEGEATYTRYDDKPPPLCDSECLFAAPPTAQAEGWRPIETAPKDCQAILVTEGRFCHCVEWNEEFDWWAVDDNKLGPFRLRGSSPTHWMPLPPPPTSAEGVEHG